MSFRVNMDSLEFKDAIQDKWIYNNDFTSEIQEFLTDPSYRDPNHYKHLVVKHVIDGFNHFSSLDYKDFIDFYKSLGEKKRQMVWNSIIRFCFTCENDTDVDIIYISTMRNFWQRVLLVGNIANNSKRSRASRVRAQLEKVGLIYRVTDIYAYSHARLSGADNGKYVIDPEKTYSYMYLVNMHLVRLLLTINKSMLDNNICLAIDKMALYTDKPTKTNTYEIYSDIAEVLSAKYYDSDIQNNLPSVVSDYLKSKTPAEVFTDIFNAIDIFKKQGNGTPSPELILAAALPDSAIINILACKYPCMNEAWKDVITLNNYILDDDFGDEQLTFKFNIERKFYMIDRNTKEKVQYLKRISIRNTSSIVSLKANVDPGDATYVKTRSDYLSSLKGKPFVETENNHWDRTASVPTTLKVLQDNIVWDNNYDFYTEEVIKKSNLDLTRDQVKDVILPVIFDKTDPITNKLRRERQKDYKTLQTELYCALSGVADFDECYEDGQNKIKKILDEKYEKLRPYYADIITAVKNCVENSIDTSMGTKVFLYESIIYLKMRKAMYEQGIRHISQVYDSFFFIDENCPANINELFDQYAHEVYELKQLDDKAITNYNNTNFNLKVKLA